MKLTKVLLGTIAISATMLSSAQARDSYSLGINIGGYGYAPQEIYYDAPRVYYRDAPVVRYYRAPVVRYTAAISFRYFNDNRRFQRHYRARHSDRGHHGWGHNNYRGGRSLNKEHRRGNNRDHQVNKRGRSRRR